MVHFLAAEAALPPADPELSTGDAGETPELVDDLPVAGTAHRLRVGLVVPKRHAKRSVTRNLVKRHCRVAIDRHLPQLAVGDWVLRLRAPIDRKVFTSASSSVLADGLRAEIEQVIGDAIRRTRAAARSAGPRPVAPAPA
ncbi:ribonuclease P protein component [Sphaerotilus hippei]|uniref:Ribonuclease P protein component n=2 Tax=Sphaerotilus hippei TaxID=744406 RepID=A0A318HDX6_9BURK|nr:ribonuclease P protein component [Sphaerotilus hippei]